MTPPLLIRGARCLTLEGAGLGVLESADVLVDSGLIAAIGRVAEVPAGARVIEARGRVLMPAFVDCHTHLCWAGDRLDEWDQKRRGASYLDILASGGGIMSTVRAVRAATQDELERGLASRLSWMLSEGTTRVEIKSGYGLSTEDELKMLRAIVAAGARWAGEVVPTACIGHALDPDIDRDLFIDRTITQTLDAVHAEFPGIAIDAYCETGAWSLAECQRLFARAMSLGHPCRVHTDQFNELGLTEWALEQGFVSVDHLEATSPAVLERVAASSTMAVILPCSGFHVDGRYAEARTVLDLGGSVAIATNANPGSAPCVSMPMAISLAVRHCGLTPAEAILAATRGGASVLSSGESRAMSLGARADLILLRHSDERELAHSFGGRAVCGVVCGGSLVRLDDDDLAG